MDKTSTVIPAKWVVPEFTVQSWQPRRHRYCVCVPVINEGERIQRQLKKMQSWADRCDIIICDGGSTDGSLIPELLQQNQVRALLTKTGPGKLSAQLRMAYAFALTEGYGGVITIDGNDKDDPTAFGEFIKALDAGFDFVQGSRFISGGQEINTPSYRKYGIRLIHAPFISYLAGFHYTDTTNGFRAYSRQFLLDDRVQPFRPIFQTYELIFYLSVVAPRLGYKTIEVPVCRAYPAVGKTPTKIKFFSGNWKILKILVRLWRGVYNV